MSKNDVVTTSELPPDEDANLENSDKQNDVDVVESALASGEWQAVTDAVSNRVYYHNISSGVVVWDLDEELQRKNRMNTDIIKKALSSGEWKMTHDEHTRVPYYYHNVSGRVCWEITEEEILKAREGDQKSVSEQSTSETKKPPSSAGAGDPVEEQEEEEEKEEEKNEAIPEPTFNPDLPGSERAQAALDSGEWSYQLDLHRLPFYTETSTGRTVRDLQLEMSQLIAREQIASKIYLNDSLHADVVLSPAREGVENDGENEIDGPDGSQKPIESKAWSSTDMNPLVKMVENDFEKDKITEGDDKENIRVPKIYQPNWDELQESMKTGNTCPIMSSKAFRESLDGDNELFNDLKRPPSVKAQPLRIRYNARKKWGDVVYANNDDIIKASEQAKTRSQIHKKTADDVKSMTEAIRHKLDSLVPNPKPPSPVAVVRPELLIYEPPEQTITVRGFYPPESYVQSTQSSELPPSPRVCPVRSIQLLKREDWPQREPQSLVNFFV